LIDGQSDAAQAGSVHSSETTITHAGADGLRPIKMMHQNSQRLLTTHVGSLPRPKDLLDLMKVKVTGAAPDPQLYVARIRSAVAECVRKQAETGIDILNDGEQAKPGFFTYVRERLEGFEPRPQQPARGWPLEVNAFPEYYEQYFKEAMSGGAIMPIVPMVCTGPIKYRGAEALKRDIENLKAAASSVEAHAVFMSSIAPSGVGSNEYYRTEEEFFQAAGAALRTEYQAIVEAGFVLQIDDPFLTDIFSDPALDASGRHKRASIYVEAINESLRGIPEEKVRFHTCYGINEGPRISDAPLDQIAPYMLKIHAGAYSFEAANARHEHEYHLWERVKLPEDKILIPGVITHASNIVEHPELIAERLIRFAKLAGRDNVIAGADCGFSSQATYRTEVHPTVVWAKFQALREGAHLASKQLWS
jgi:5-methyltetrahydropteroyltriglutamate--homocysteine methyltransferase